MTNRQETYMVHDQYPCFLVRCSKRLDLQLVQWKTSQRSSALLQADSCLRQLLQAEIQGARLSYRKDNRIC